MLEWFSLPGLWSPPSVASEWFSPVLHSLSTTTKPPPPPPDTPVLQVSCLLNGLELEFASGVVEVSYPGGIFLGVGVP